LTELELAALIYKSLREGEHEGIVRFRRWDASLHPEGIVSSGPNNWKISGHAMTVTGVGLSPSLPWGASRREITSGDLVVIDMGINFHGYHADVARTYIVGKADAKQNEMAAIVRDIYRSLLECVTAGVEGRVIRHAAEKAAEVNGVSDYFEGYGDIQGDYIGHGIGIEMDEPPVIDRRCNTVLREGDGAGLRAENHHPWLGSYIYRRHGCRNLHRL